LLSTTPPFREGLAGEILKARLTRESGNQPATFVVSQKTHRRMLPQSAALERIGNAGERSRAEC